MKSIVLVSAAIGIFTIASCNKKQEPPTQVIKVETEKPVVVEEKKPVTKVRINPNGGAVQNGDVDIEVSK